MFALYLFLEQPVIKKIELAVANCLPTKLTYGINPTSSKWLDVSTLEESKRVFSDRASGVRVINSGINTFYENVQKITLIHNLKTNYNAKKPTR